MTKPQPKPVTALEVLPPDNATSAPQGALLNFDLSASINAAYLAARAAADNATDQARAAITSAVECGNLLLRQKASLPHGAWLPWLAQYCPDISAETARRYMRLSKRSQVTDLTDATSLRQAYLATGVLPEPPPRDNDTPDANTPLVTFTRGLDQFPRWFHRRTEDKPLPKWTPEARRLLRKELTWFVNLHSELK